VDLSFDLSRRARSIIQSPEYADIFPSVGLAYDARAVGQWELVDPQAQDAKGQALPHKGGYVSAGVGGGITGKGADLLIIDDPVKNAEEAASKTILDAHWEWYTSTAYTRLEGRGAVIVIMTRWASDDLAGRLLQASDNRTGDQWHRLRLPALAEDDDELGREPGEALWETKYDADALKDIQRAIGSRNFAALYQQRPAPLGGATFKREWFTHTYNAFARNAAVQVVQVWDTAFKTKQQNDYSVCATWALVGNNAYIVDVFRDRVEFPVLKRKAQELYAKWTPNIVLIEDRASGQSLVQELKHETRIPVVAADIDADKVVRASAVTPYFEAGRVLVPVSAPWLDEWVEEHAAFPNGAHDDQVDTTSMALRRIFPAGGQTGNRTAVGPPRPVSAFTPR
jgi:predicted phage terminase large subunit-like protein